MSRHRLRDVLRYRFDQAMSRGPSALVGWLLAVTLTVVLLLGSVVVVARLAPVQDGQAPALSASLWTPCPRVAQRRPGPSTSF